MADNIPNSPVRRTGGFLHSHRRPVLRPHRSKGNLVEETLSSDCLGMAQGLTANAYVIIRNLIQYEYHFD